VFLLHKEEMNMTRRNLEFEQSPAKRDGTLNSPGCSPQGKAGVASRENRSRVAVAQRHLDQRLGDKVPTRTKAL